MISTNYPKENLIFVQGKVEDTLPKTRPSKVSLLRLDTDWYESTKKELEFLFPLLEKGGILIVDDYGHFAGSKKAVDDYFEKKPILLNRIDYSARIVIKR
jgi:O-methyltransferase